MSLKAIFYAYILGGLTFIPLLLIILVSIALYSSIPISHHTPKLSIPNPLTEPEPEPELSLSSDHVSVDDHPKTRKAWLTMRRSFEESTSDASYVTLVRSYLDARSKDPKRSRPKDMWYVVLKGKVLYLYEDESMTECEAALELGGHDLFIYPQGLLDGELFTRRNAICIRPRQQLPNKPTPSLTSDTPHQDIILDQPAGSEDKHHDSFSQDSFTTSSPWFIFVRSCVDMEDWYLALLHASEHPAATPTLNPLLSVFLPSEMNQLVVTLDQQPDVIPMRWLNALIGRIFFSFYRTQILESYVIARLMKKLSKVKRPAFLTEIAITEFSIGNKAPMLSKPMLKELTKEGDASLEVRFVYKGELRATVQATATINLGARFKSYTVKLVLAVILREIDGNLLIKVKRPPSTRIWYAFTQTPRLVIDVEPIVSDRQITWSMILDTIKSRIIEVIQESVVMPNMDDISFFDSSQFAHRGGLWSDAARHQKSEPASSPSETEGVKPPPSEPDLPSISIASEELASLPINRSQSTEDLVAEVSPNEAFPVVRSGTTGTSENDTKASRRRSWFSSGGDEAEVGEREVEESDSVRGRRSRASSSGTPMQELPPNSSPEKPAGEMELQEETPVYLSPQYRDRSSSANSQTRSRSSRADSISSSAPADDESSNYISDSGMVSKNARHSIGPTTASSFLSTLKSKAADKQALSNSAKEAMRKFGVNWGLKKETGLNGSPDDVTDAGPSGAHGRPSYAEVRAAVSERKERRDEGGSAAVPISDGTGRRSISASSGHIVSSTGAPASSPPMKQSGLSEGSSSSKFVAPSLSRENATGDALTDREFTDATEEHRRSSIIHTQPLQARTMTIPGIHASHRGEPMSIGNIAPSLPPPETKAKVAAIQSMYRLWKSPILAGQQQWTENPLTRVRTETDERNNGDVAPLNLSTEVISPPRPVPPPLPPRTISSVVVVRETLNSLDDSVALSSFPVSEALENVASREEMQPALPMQRSTPELVQSSSLDVTSEPAIVKGPPLPPRRVQGAA